MIMKPIKLLEPGCFRELDPFNESRLILTAQGDMEPNSEMLSNQSRMKALRAGASLSNAALCIERVACSPALLSVQTAIFILMSIPGKAPKHIPTCAGLSDLEYAHGSCLQALQERMETLQMSWGDDRDFMRVFYDPKEEWLSYVYQELAREGAETLREFARIKQGITTLVISHWACRIMSSLQYLRRQPRQIPEEWMEPVEMIELIFSPNGLEEENWLRLTCFPVLA